MNIIVKTVGGVVGAYGLALYFGSPGIESVNHKLGLDQNVTGNKLLLATSAAAVLGAIL